MASIAIRTQVRRWVSGHQELAPLPSVLHTASTSVCSSWSANSCAIGTTSPESSLESPRYVEGRAKQTRCCWGTRFIVVRGENNHAGPI